jgi:hypothetical protein
VAGNQEEATEVEMEAVAVGEDPEQVQRDGTRACVECGQRCFETSAYNLEIGMETEGHGE